MSIAVNHKSTRLTMESSQTYMSFGKIALWLVALYIIPKFYSYIILLGSYYVQQESAVTSDGFLLWMQKTSVMLTGSALAFLLTIPVLAKVTEGANWQQRCQWLNIHKVNAVKLLAWGAGFAGIFLVFQVLNIALDVPAEPFMAKLKVEFSDSPLIFLLFFCACVLAPLFEEIVLRGWLYQRLLNKQVNEKVVIVLSSLLFAVSHEQYGHYLTFFAIFTYGCFLAIVRSRTQNLSYPILIHMLYNTALLVHLFFFS
ncbi:CPBP family intramembrane glutamic endopeptidase [Thalassotalea fusca]